MPNAYKLLVAYDGTDYEGWQTQPHGNTVVDLLERSFSRVFDIPCTILGSSRTDAGVHALGQVALLKTSAALPLVPERIRVLWSRILPPSVSIRSLQCASPEFYPLKNVQLKTYYYHIFQSRPLPFCGRYGVWPKRSFDHDRFVRSLNLFQGTHDFRSFSTGYDMTSTICSIRSIGLRYVKRYGVWRVTVQGERFLRYMIRRIVGAALDTALLASKNEQQIKDALANPHPEQPFTTAPARGLLLHSIRYT